MAVLKRIYPNWNKSRIIHVNKCLNLNNRIKGSTLMETMVATVLIVVIFMISSMTMNNFLATNIKQNTELAEERLNVLAYQLQNKGIELPYYEDFESWEISIFKVNKGSESVVTLEALNTTTKALVANYIINDD